jgi:hypothetical protein
MELLFWMAVSEGGHDYKGALDFYERTDLHNLFGGDAEEARRGRSVLGEENEDALPPGRHLGPRRRNRYGPSHEVGNAVAIHFAAEIDVPFQSTLERAWHIR